MGELCVTVPHPQQRGKREGTGGRQTVGEGKEDPYLYKVLSKISQLLLTITYPQNERVPVKPCWAPIALSLAPQAWQILLHNLLVMQKPLKQDPSNFPFISTNMIPITAFQQPMNHSLDEIWSFCKWNPRPFNTTRTNKFSQQRKIKMKICYSHFLPAQCQPSAAHSTSRGERTGWPALQWWQFHSLSASYNRSPAGWEEFPFQQQKWH